MTIHRLNLCKWLQGESSKTMSHDNSPLELLLSCVPSTNSAENSSMNMVDIYQESLEYCIGYLSHDIDKMPDRGHLEKEGFTLGNSLRILSIMEGKPWRHELVTGHHVYLPSRSSLVDQSETPDHGLVLSAFILIYLFCIPTTVSPPSTPPSSSFPPILQIHSASYSFSEKSRSPGDNSQTGKNKIK